MELTPYVDRLRSDLSDAAAAGGAEAQGAAERLALALDPATRMVLLEALAQAAAEISGSLEHDAAGSPDRPPHPHLTARRTRTGVPSCTPSRHRVPRRSWSAPGPATSRSRPATPTPPP